MFLVALGGANRITGYWTRGGIWLSERSKVAPVDLIWSLPYACQ